MSSNYLLNIDNVPGAVPNAPDAPARRKSPVLREHALWWERQTTHKRVKETVHPMVKKWQREKQFREGKERPPGGWHLGTQHGQGGTPGELRAGSWSGKAPQLETWMLELVSGWHPWPRGCRHRSHSIDWPPNTRSKILPPRPCDLTHPVHTGSDSDFRNRKYSFSTSKVWTIIKKTGLVSL